MYWIHNLPDVRGFRTFKMKALSYHKSHPNWQGRNLLNLKISDFKDGIKEVYDNDEVRKTYQLFLEGKKTHINFTTFFSEEVVEAI